MTLKEFLEKNPDAVKEAANCSTAKEFEKLANKVGITFDNDEDLEQAFDIVKQQHNGELTDDALDAVSGGVAGGRYFKPNQIYRTYGGDIYTRGTGKKA